MSLNTALYFLAGKSTLPVTSSEVALQILSTVQDCIVRSRYNFSLASLKYGATVLLPGKSNLPVTSSEVALQILTKIRTGNLGIQCWTNLKF